ncbi:MAG: ROK family protein, partial [Deltaproteobacteria bacterium]|nr:ROK family protein [Deltaproteobacteria bacterium]
MITLGVDLGGTNFRAATFEGDSWAPIDHIKEAVGDRRDPASMVDRIADLAVRLARGQPATLGIGIAAMLRDRIGTVANSPHLRWRDVAFGTLLAARLGPQFRIGVYNDVNAIVWGEAVAGA